ncbi:MAG: hypothetical protein QF655_00915 [Candidatus Woesearchaeota archaeon]|jgi:hypothetical protein|nr:hypothetical protein [Candidatus Woesearchaeota archaeon]MDP6265865.1 hypothetical protein [Candidatus Woesearchaeota archaeon]MDP7322652.1 hypothetical protein [Candidatus Woesearchaeota archaeon]MDP7476177.1 hypothetical protein [Candidatus Woesearchaeota archaeon]HJO02145.1 hypothetical protein [Candidatus Woesearchaeota archaeon]|tara:strand:+ start:274 stop:519 length:246 start_codon:yes stop_codon:yes gene_type:complete
MVLNPDLGVKLIFILGIVNLFSIVLIFFSCRCLAGQKFTSRMMQYAWYKKFYAMHCYYWWIFIISVILHTALAFSAFGNPL